MLPLVFVAVMVPVDMVSFASVENASSESFLSLKRVTKVSTLTICHTMYLRLVSQKPTSTLRVSRVAATTSTSGAPLISSATAAFVLALVLLVPVLMVSTCSLLVVIQPS